MDDAQIPVQLNIEEALSRIQLQSAETRKFAAEQNKLAAEAGKLRFDRWLAPVIALASLITAGGAVVIAYTALMRH